jgi:hypothetical protein
MFALSVVQRTTDTLSSIRVHRIERDDFLRFAILVDATENVGWCEFLEF